MSPVFFILVSLAATSAVLSTIFYLTWKTQDRHTHALTWAVAFAVGVLQWITHLVSDWFPSWELYWSTANLALLGVLTLGLLGHCQRVSSRLTLATIVAPAVAVYIGILFFTWVAPHAGLRMSLGSFYSACTLFLSALLVLGHRQQPRTAERAAGIAMVLFGMFQLAAGTTALMQGATYSEYFNNMYLQITYLTTPAAYSGVGMFVLFMLASDMSETMREIAIRDQLTGLLNRRGFGEAAAAAYATSRRTGRPVSVIMTDIDRFKGINDEYGHSTGDEALCHFSDILRDKRRADDILARIGGEEFALVLPGTQVEEAIRIADELCTRLANTPMETDLGDLHMTSSFGVATISVNDTCLTDVIIRADAALYRSKRAGRNRIDLESSQMMLTPAGRLEPISGRG